MAKVTASGSDAKTSQALGAGLALLATFMASIAFAFVLPRLAFYVTFLMPALVGILLAAIGAIGPRRFGFSNKRALIAIMIGGALIAWVGHHLFAYLRLVDHLAEQWAAAGSGPADATTAALAALAEQTGETGFMAYLTFVSQGQGAQISPIGILGKSQLGAGGTVLVAVVELAIMAGVASWNILFRTRHLRDQRASEPLGAVDAGVLAEMMRHVDARRWEDAGRALASPAAMPTHLVALIDGEATTELQVFSTDALGRADERVSQKLLPIEGGRAMRAAFVAALRGKGGPS